MKLSRWASSPEGERRGDRVVVVARRGSRTGAGRSRGCRPGARPAPWRRSGRPSSGRCGPCRSACSGSGRSGRTRPGSSWPSRRGRPRACRPGRSRRGGRRRAGPPAARRLVVVDVDDDVVDHRAVAGPGLGRLDPHVLLEAASGPGGGRSRRVPCAGTTYGSGISKTTSGVPIVQPSGNVRRGGIAFGSPSGVPCSTQASSVARSWAVRLRSFSKWP